MTFLVLVVALAVLSGCVSHPAASQPSAAAATRPSPRRLGIRRLVDQPDSWFKTPDGLAIVDSILAWQNANGGWWKNYDPRKPRGPLRPDRRSPPGDEDSLWHRVSTFDNNATHSEMRILARAYRVLGEEACRQAFERGLAYIFESQYPNGGWPQRFPLQNNYGRRITFNDDAMTGVMALLKDVADGKPDFAFVPEDQRRVAQQAFDRGVQCILKCQIKFNGKLTVWCQQHDEVTLVPAGGRAYELPSLCGDESADIVLLLMSIEHPDARVRQSIEAAVAWFASAKITGKRWTMVDDPTASRGRDRVLVDDPAAPPIWARFYDLKTGQPFFCGRDGIPHSSVDQISYERRMGYGWYGQWGRAVEKAYPAWKARWEQSSTPTAVP
ncbi:MAG: pectate lyase [Tepidisphaeraceae bacterium]